MPACLSLVSDGTAEAVGNPTASRSRSPNSGDRGGATGVGAGAVARVMAAEDQTSIELSRLGDEDQAVAVVRARRSGGELELDSAHVDAGQYPAVATTESLASAAALELERLPDERWHRLVLVLEHPRN